MPFHKDDGQLYAKKAVAATWSRVGLASIFSTYLCLVRVTVLCVCVCDSKEMIPESSASLKRSMRSRMTVKRSNGQGMQSSSMGLFSLGMQSRPRQK